MIYGPRTALTLFSSSLKNAPTNASRCPAKVFGLYPSSGCSVYSLAVMSLEAVMKYLFRAV